MKRTLAIRYSGVSTSEPSKATGGTKHGLVLLMPLLCAPALVLSALGAQPGAVLTVLHSFHVYPNGASPRGLVQGSDGNFYGTCGGGGTNGGNGTVFRLSTNGVLTTLYSFTGGSDGAGPNAPLVQGSDGNFYGTTSQGGRNGWGTVFKITPRDGVLTNLHSFQGVSDGGLPSAPLVQGSDGYFYGTTCSLQDNQRFDLLHHKSRLPTAKLDVQHGSRFT